MSTCVVKHTRTQDLYTSNYYGFIRSLKTLCSHRPRTLFWTFLKIYYSVNVQFGANNDSISERVNNLTIKYTNTT